MSECSPVISNNTPENHKKGSIGKPLENVEIRFENGEILVKGSSVMKGYYQMPDETAETLKDGWLHTGDKGYMDEDGYLFINGRVKNLIILSNGENVSPEEIENKLALNPLVGEVIVTGENNGLTARIYPEQAVVEAKALDKEAIQTQLQAFLDEYNRKAEQIKEAGAEEEPVKMPQIVIIVDELADLMMVAPGEVEDAICRLAQLARAAGIHLIIATQRPSVNVITGLIKANMPSRIAFSVSSGVDSRTILDMNGAEKLLGKGDMLFYPQGYQKPARLQGAFVSDDEVSAVVEFLADKNPGVQYNQQIEQQVNSPVTAAGMSGDDRDVHFEEAGKFIIEKEKASIGMLQRMFKIGFNRAARIMDQLCDAGVVGPEEGTKPRKVLMSMEEFQNYLENQ